MPESAFQRSILSAFLLVAVLTMAGCASSGPQAPATFRKDVSCALVQAYYDSDFDRFRTILTRYGDPDQMTNAKIYAVRKEIDVFGARLIRNEWFECDIRVNGNGLTVAYGKVKQDWDHGTGVVGFGWLLDFSRWGGREKSLRNFRIVERIITYKSSNRPELSQSANF